MGVWTLASAEQTFSATSPSRAGPCHKDRDLYEVTEGLAITVQERGWAQVVIACLER
jgi:hypothetical protein